MSVLLLLLIGLVMLVAGAEFLVRGGGNVARRLHIPALVVGLTIVAFGTSAPELTVSVIAAFEASTAVAMSNVNGSNLANILFVLGAAALVRPFRVERSLLRREIPWVLGLQISVPVLAFDGMFSRTDGALVVIAGVLYNGWLILSSLRKPVPTGDDADGDEEWDTDSPIVKHLAMLFIGLVVLVVGAKLFVDSAVAIASHVGMSDRLIGLTVIALGTSAPEVATSVVASYQDEAEMAVGNSVGSNILNIAMVLGITALIRPIDLSSGGFMTDMFVTLGATLFLIPLVVKSQVNRIDGALMITAYISYLTLQYFWG